FRGYLLRSIVRVRAEKRWSVGEATAFPRDRRHRSVLPHEERDAADHGCGVRAPDRGNDEKESEPDRRAARNGTRFLRDVRPCLLRRFSDAQHYWNGPGFVAGEQAVRREG